MGPGEDLGVEGPGHLLRPGAVIDHRSFRPEIDMVANHADMEPLLGQPIPGLVSQHPGPGAVPDLNDAGYQLFGGRRRQGNPGLDQGFRRGGRRPLKG